MAELTEQQLERAKQELAKEFGGPVDDVLMTNMLRTAAPFLQLPWGNLLTDDPRHIAVRGAVVSITDDIIEGWMQGGCWPSSGDQCEYTNRILTALDEVKP